MVRDTECYADREHVRANRAEHRAQLLERDLIKVLDAIGVVPQHMLTIAITEAIADARLLLYRIHRNDPPTVLPPDPDPEAPRIELGHDPPTAMPCKCTATLLTHGMIFIQRGTTKHTRTECYTCDARGTRIGLPPSPPPPPLPPPDLHRWRADLNRWLAELIAERDECLRAREREHGHRLYRAHARCIAIVPHRRADAYGVELELETEHAERVRLTLELHSPRNLTPLLAAPLVLTLEELDPPDDDAPPTVSTPTDHDANDLSTCAGEPW